MVARDGAKAEYDYSYKRQRWFKYYALEHSISENLCEIYMFLFGKFHVYGKNAMQTLQYISCANIDVEPGKIVYTQWLNERGGIEADLTISRLNEESFHVITSISSLTRDWSHLNKHLMTDTFVEDVSMNLHVCLCKDQILEMCYKK